MGFEYAQALTVAFAGVAALGLAHQSLSTTRGHALWRELGELFAPSHAVHDSLNAFAEMLRLRYGAESCLLVLEDCAGGRARLYVAAANQASARRAELLQPGMARALLALPAERIALYRRGLFSRSAPQTRSYDCRSLDAREGDAATLQALASLLEARSLLSVPLRSGSRILGRLHLVGAGRFRRRQLLSLAQVVAQGGAWIDHMHRVERLSDTVAVQERRRISRDLHDGTVQPYIGLKLGLEALRRRMGEDDCSARDVEELIRMAADGIAELRRYVCRLKEEQERQGRTESLVQGVRYQAGRFAEYYGVRTQVLAASDVVVGAPLFEEVMQIVREALSNVRRHTHAICATIELRVEAGALLLEVSNDRGHGAGTVARFHPASIDARSRELGGRTQVHLRDNGDTVVAVRIPL